MNRVKLNKNAAVPNYYVWRCSPPVLQRPQTAAFLYLFQRNLLHTTKKRQKLCIDRIKIFFSYVVPGTRKLTRKRVLVDENGARTEKTISNSYDVERNY